MPTDLKSVIAANLAAVRDSITDAAKTSGRGAEDVKLVAVTKYAQPEWVRCLTTLHAVFGESRPQQLAERAAELDAEIEWHLIGQLQRNKVRSILPASHLIHSVDSWRLLDRIELIAGELELKPRVLLQVNVSGEEAKAGFSPDEFEAHTEKLLAYDATQIDGLMTMAPITRDAESTRAVFADLRVLRDGLRSSSGMALPELSMGMSGDFEVAIEEGATLVRVGSRLFDGLNYRG